MNADVTGVSEVKKSFGTQTVLDGVSLELGSRKVTCVLGRSGTGKSVLLKILVGLEVADAGTVHLAGADITDGEQPRLNEARKQVGFLFQQGALYDSMTIEANVAFPLKRHLNLTDGDLRQKVTELLSSVGLDGHGAKYPAQLSGGMKKRAGLARALALEPRVLLFDEPTAGLDPISAAEIATLIAKLRDEKGMTSLVVTHDLPTARKIADRLVALDAGKVSFDGSLAEFEQSSNGFITQYLKDAS